MVQYTFQHQLKIKEFSTLYQIHLHPENRWVQLAFYFPWDQCMRIFAHHFADNGRTAINPRIVIGSLVIKHKMNLSDEDTVRIIEENPYRKVGPDAVLLRPE